MNRLIAALAALVALACVVLIPPAKSQPSVNTAETYARAIYNDTLSQAVADSSTVPGYTDSVNVTGYRGLQLYWYSTGGVGNGVDTLQAPLMQFKILNGAWYGTGLIQFAALNIHSSIPASGYLNLVPNGKLAFSACGAWSGTAGETPLPMNGWVRWKLRSGNARRHLNGTTAVVATQGRITVVAVLVK